MLISHLIIKWISFISLMLLFVSTVMAQRPSVDDINLMTFNIRYPNPDDGFNYWPKRKQLVASMIQFHDADIVGLQEAFRSQLADIEEMLPTYAWHGVCRTSGDKKPNPDNEFSAILYKRERFDLLEGDTFWLSETPDEVGKAGWDANLPRIVSWAKFRDKQNDRTFFHFNTHFDHRGEVAREESAKLLLQQISTIADTAPVVVTGDFNAIPESVPYRTIVDENNPEHLTDAMGITQMPHHGPNGSSTNSFLFPGVPGRRIDYIFIKNGVSIMRHAILSDSWSGRLPSDHLPVLATCRLP